jgi:hypothetical protein
MLVLNYFLTVLHEIGHKNVANQYDIDLKIRLKTPSLSRIFQKGSAQFATKEDCQKFNQLAQLDKSRILLAGIKNDIKTAHILLFFCIIFPILAIISKKEKLKLLFLMIWIIFLGLIALEIIDISTNLKYYPGTDFYYLFNNFTC